MQFVYLCRSGDNEELKYSIRSLVKYFNNASIIVVGGKPDWYTGEFINVTQNKSKHENVRNSIISLCQSDLVDDTFVLMNDDFFLTQYIDHIPTFHGGLFSEKIKFYKQNAEHSSYTKILENTEKSLTLKGYSNILDYAIHVPMVMKKHKLLSILEPNTSFRTLYGNIYSVGGLAIKDVKIYTNGPLWAKSYDFQEKDMPFFSTNDKSFKKAYNNLLKRDLQRRSSYEK